MNVLVAKYFSTSRRAAAIWFCASNQWHADTPLRWAAFERNRNWLHVWWVFTTYKRLKLARHKLALISITGFCAYIIQVKFVRQRLKKILYTGPVLRWSLVHSSAHAVCEFRGFSYRNFFSTSLINFCGNDWNQYRCQVHLLFDLIHPEL